MSNTSNSSPISNFLSVQTFTTRLTLEQILVKDYLQMQKYFESASDDVQLQDFYRRILDLIELPSSDMPSNEDMSSQTSSPALRQISKTGAESQSQYAPPPRQTAFASSLVSPYPPTVSNTRSIALQTRNEDADRTIQHAVTEWLIIVTGHRPGTEEQHLLLTWDTGSRSTSSWIWGTQHPIRDKSLQAGSTVHPVYKYLREDVVTDRGWISFDGGSGNAEVVYDAFKRPDHRRSSDILPFRVNHLASRILGITCSDVYLGIRINGQGREHALGHFNIGLAVVGSYSHIHGNTDGVLGLDPYNLAGEYAEGTWMSKAFTRGNRNPIFWFRANNRLYFGEYNWELENRTRELIRITLWQYPAVGGQFWAGRLTGYKVTSSGNASCMPFIRFADNGTAPLSTGQTIPNPGSIKTNFDTGSQLSFLGFDHMTRIMEMIRREGVDVWGGSRAQGEGFCIDPMSVDAQQANALEVSIHFRFATAERDEVDLLVPLEWLFFGSEVHPVAGRNGRLLSLQPFGVSFGFPTEAIRTDQWASQAIFGMLLMTKYTMFFNGNDNYVAFGY
ncbi:hypothetical protein FISHEDRAFT_78073 [Fistulina hepatica ATCC 64428]|nr:hypothetical protein FISHEDRAFT_78073 [Fistulina hepatica ATCC 64428]